MVSGVLGLVILMVLTFRELLETGSQFRDSFHTTRRCRILGRRHPGKCSSWAWGPCNVGGGLHLSRGLRRAVLRDVPLGLQKRDPESRAVQSVRAVRLQRAQRDL